MSKQKNTDNEKATATQKAVTGTNGTKGDAKAVLDARIVALDNLAVNSVKFGERKQAKVHADLLRDVRKEIFGK